MGLQQLGLLKRAILASEGAILIWGWQYGPHSGAAILKWGLTIETSEKGHYS